MCFKGLWNKLRPAQTDENQESPDIELASPVHKQSKILGMNDSREIDVPLVVEEKRSHLISDPGVSTLSATDLTPNHTDRILEMKKVSSLALV